MDIIFIEQLAFAVVTIAIGWLAVLNLRGLTGRLFVTGLALGVFLLGPHVFGREWYYEGFVAGMIFGDCFGSIATREEIEEEGSAKSN